MRNLKALFIAVALATAPLNSTPLIIRTGTTLKTFQVLGWVNFTYNQTVKSYNWDTNEFIKPEGFEPTTTAGADILASVGLPGKLELGGVLPVMMKSKGETSSQGIGDLLLVARYGILQSPLLPVRMALSVGISLPTGDKNANPALGDGSTDLGIALALNTVKLGFVTGHLRAAYWLNGKTDENTRLGNMLQYMAGLDFSILPKLTPQITFTGYNQKAKLVNGTPLPNSEIDRGFLGVLFLWQPIPKLTLRPKVSFPLPPLCKGGALADYNLGLDAWITLP